MPLRFFRRVRIAPGLTLNLSRSGPSLSMGVRGAHVTVGRRGVRRTVGLPGTGLFYTSHTGAHTGAHTAKAFAVSPAERERQKLLRHLDALHHAGVLTDAEYAAKQEALRLPP
jgi:hypothetical protein